MSYDLKRKLILCALALAMLVAAVEAGLLVRDLEVALHRPVYKDGPSPFIRAKLGGIMRV